MAGKKRGRPMWAPTPEILKTVEDYAALGVKKEQIAFAINLSPQTYSEKQVQFPEINEAFMRGRAKGVAFAASKLHKLVEALHYPAIQFYLKAQGDWKENDPADKPPTPLVIKVDGKLVEMS
jgi:hypothetical protein